jgi:hypothetical protein
MVLEFDTVDGNHLICFKGKDAEGIYEKKLICSISPIEEADKMAFIDEVKKRLAISDMAERMERNGARKDFRYYLSIAGKKRFRNFDKVRQDELNFIDDSLGPAYPPSITTHQNL